MVSQVQEAKLVLGYQLLQHVTAQYKRVCYTFFTWKHWVNLFSKNCVYDEATFQLSGHVRLCGRGTVCRHWWSRVQGTVPSSASLVLYPNKKRGPSPSPPFFFSFFPPDMLTGLVYLDTLEEFLMVLLLWKKRALMSRCSIKMECCHIFTLQSLGLIVSTEWFGIGVPFHLVTLLSWICISQFLLPGVHKRCCLCSATTHHFPGTYWEGAGTDGNSCTHHAELYIRIW